MKRSLKMVTLLISFTFAASMANATNFSKSVKSAAEEQGDSVKTDTPPALESAPVVAEPAAERESLDDVIQIPAEEIEDPVVSEPAPITKFEPAAKRESSPKPTFSGKPYEVQTFDRLMLVCPEGYACKGGSGADYKCVPDKTASIGGHGEVCKTTPRR